jgi:cysteinyl-tRNA synthetase
MKIYNTLSRKKEEFIPINKDEITIYVCGPTVYNFFHIGNARPFVVFDTLRKYLEYRGNNVKFVQNFTDVDDKIINRAREEKMIPKDLTEKYIAEYYKDAESLNVKKASVHPKVTENMDEIIAFVSELIDKGHAYEIGGDVYFSTKSFEGYGKLSKQNIDELESGARVEVEEKKKDPLDFALWKAQKTEDELAWEAPFGKGRPGWHIECSVMATKYLGDTIDIHAGGQDLTFPHHENEIAQSEAKTGKKFSNYWMHNGYITIDNEKMSKSKGNFFTVRDILKDYDGEVIRFFLLSGHYRSPINFSRELMEQSKQGLARMINSKNNLQFFLKSSQGELNKKEKAWLDMMDHNKSKFIEAMDDDLNTADAISAIFELIKEINSNTDENSSKEFVEEELSLLNELTTVLGLLKDKDEEDIDAEIQSLIDERQQARKDKNFKRSDEIRDILKSKGIVLEDTQGGIRIVRLS